MIFVAVVERDAKTDGLKEVSLRELTDVGLECAIKDCRDLLSKLEDRYDREMGDSHGRRG